MKLPLFALALTVGPAAALNDEFKIMAGHDKLDNYESALPYTYIAEDDLPESFDWGNVDGKSYLTHSLNQHVPQYCGSCWAHGAMSALADRIKIAREAKGEEINLSIQFILNCGTKVAGSCHGGSASGAYHFVYENGFVPYDTCMPYTACSSESDDGFCPHVDTTCSAMNTCRTCDTFAGNGGACAAISVFPNTTIAEYGTYNLFTMDKVHKIKAEVFARGPVAAGINAEPIIDYKGGIVKDEQLFHKMVNHIVSIVGWGVDETDGTEYWIVRNSWGTYWGEMGYVRVETGKDSLGIESMIAWATPGTFTINNVPCSEDGSSCGDNVHLYRDPSLDVTKVQRRLGAGAN
eukprot:scaffold215479_cov42-Attheya_sp.AAC.1